MDIYSVGYNSYLSLAISMYFTSITKSNQQRITDWLNIKIGKVASSIFRYTTAIFLLILAAFTMGETIQWISATFLPTTPVLFILIIYTILCILLVSTNIQTIAMVNVLVLLLVTVFGFFIAFTNIQVKDYELLRPFFEHGFQPVLTSAVFPASGFVELVLFLLHSTSSQRPLPMVSFCNHAIDFNGVDFGAYHWGHYRVWSN